MSEPELEELREAFIRLLGAERRLRGREGQSADELSLSHYRLLTRLLDHPELPAGRLALAADLSPGSTTQMLDVLEKRGFVVRTRDTTDRRIVLASLTAKGRRLTEGRRAQFRAVWTEELGELDPEELAAGAAVLDRVTRVLEQLAERGVEAGAPAGR